jgi:hypothetical protein
MSTLRSARVAALMAATKKLAKSGSLLDRDNWYADFNWYTDGVRIAWYDKHLKLWTTYLVDRQGNQVGDTNYFNNKTDWADAQRRGWFTNDLIELGDILTEEYVFEGEALQ